MKNLTAVIIAIAMVMIFSSCSDADIKEEDSSAEYTESSAVTDAEENSSSKNILDEEKYTSEIVTPDFKIPYTLSDCKSYSEFDYDSSDKEGNTVKYYKSKTITAEETYGAENRLVSSEIYEKDGKTVKTEIKYEYEAETSCSVDYYKNGEETERFKFTYDENEKIVSAYHMELTKSDDSLPLIESYEFDPNGNITRYIDSDGVSQALMDAVFSALGDL